MIIEIVEDACTIGTIGTVAGECGKNAENGILMTTNALPNAESAAAKKKCTVLMCVSIRQTITSG
jgi:hypothetical protein